jgi:hypothetical protein
MIISIVYQGLVKNPDSKSTGQSVLVINMMLTFDAFNRKAQTLITFYLYDF